jgi:uncharacterized membrane protein YkoI
MVARWKSSVVVALISIAGLTAGGTWVSADETKELSTTPCEFAPLRNLLALVHQRHPGRILEVELEQEEYGEKDIWIYEVKMLTRRGRVYQLEYDATTLELLNTEGHPREH